MFNFRWLLLNSRPYKMTDEDSGEIREGISIRYLSSDNFNPVSKDDSKGIRQTKSSVSMDFLPKITQVPALYDFTIDMTADAQGNPKIEILDMEFASLVSIVPVPAEKAPTEKAK